MDENNLMPGSGESYVLPDEFFDMDEDELEEEIMNVSQSEQRFQDEEIMGVSATARATSEDNFRKKKAKGSFLAGLRSIFSRKKDKKSGKGRGKKKSSPADEEMELSEDLTDDEGMEEKNPSPKKGKKGKKKKKAAKKKTGKKGNKKKNKGKEPAGAGGKKKLILIPILVIAVAAGGFFVLKSRGMTGGDSPGKAEGSRDTTGVVSVDISEQKEDYTVLEALFEDGVELTEDGYDPDWYKVNFTYRYGHQNKKGLFDVIDFTSYLEQLEEEAASEGEAAGEESRAEDGDAAAEETDGDDEEGSREPESGDSEDAEQKEPEPTPVQTLYDQVQKAESCAEMWAYARGFVNSYRTRGNEGYRNLVPEFSQKYMDAGEYKTFRDAVSCTMLFANMNSFEISKTLLSEDYSCAYIEFTRNLNVSRCINPSLLDRTPLQGISEGSINLQRFQLEMRYSEEEEQYLISRFRLLKTTERPQITDVVSDHSEEDSE